MEPGEKGGLPCSMGRIGRGAVFLVRFELAEHEVVVSVGRDDGESLTPRNRCTFAEQAVLLLRAAIVDPGANFR